MAYIGQSIKNGTFAVLDTSGNTYNGSNTTFSLGTQVGSAAQLLVSHDGVIQKPGTDYTLASGGASITFTTAPASGASIFIVEISGAVGGTITPSDSSVTSAKLSGNLVTPGTLDVNGQELILDADGDTSITADTDDQIDFKTGGTDRATIDSSGNLKYNSGYGSVETAFACRAWVQFNGTGTVAIQGSGNVSSITDSGTGEYIMNFTNDMPDDNYCAVCSSGENDNSNVSNHHGAQPARDAPLVGSFLLNTISATGSFVDHQFVYTAIFR